MKRVNLKLALLPVLIGCMTGCDPVFYLYARQSLQPAPALGCIAASLAASSEIIKIEKSPPDQLWVAIRDSVTGRKFMSAVESEGESIKLTFIWGGYKAIFRPSAEEIDATAAFARSSLARVRSSCAPEAPEAVHCSLSNGRELSCTGQTN